MRVSKSQKISLEERKEKNDENGSRKSIAGKKSKHYYVHTETIEGKQAGKLVHKQV
jgi:hypothetical protein